MQKEIFALYCLVIIVFNLLLLIIKVKVDRTNVDLISLSDLIKTVERINDVQIDKNDIVLNSKHFGYNYKTNLIYLKEGQKNASFLIHTLHEFSHSIHNRFVNKSYLQLVFHVKVVSWVSTILALVILIIDPNTTNLHLIITFSTILHILNVINMAVIEHSTNKILIPILDHINLKLGIFKRYIYLNELTQFLERAFIVFVHLLVLTYIYY